MKKEFVRKSLVRFPARNRILLLLQKAVQHAVVMVTAGDGYGKTNDLKLFLNRTAYRHIWFSLTPLDQEPAPFWSGFCQALKGFSPLLYEKLQDMEFPNTTHKFEHFLRIFAPHIYEGGRVILVLDEYDSIDRPFIDSFFKQLVAAELENFCMLFVTREKTILGASAYRRRDLFTINSDDMSYRPSEIQTLIKSHVHALTAKQLKTVVELTDGWPAALAILAEQEDYSIENMPAHLAVLDVVFEEYFAPYPKEMQTLLVQLSLLDVFTLEIIRMLRGYEPLELFDFFKKNMFVTYDRGLKQYAFRPLYKQFLRRYDMMLEEETRCMLLQKAGEMNLKEGRVTDALNCFFRVGNNTRILEIIEEYHQTEVSIDLEHATFFLQMLNQMDAEAVQDPLRLKFLKAATLLNNMDLLAAKTLFEELTQELEKGERLSEVYWRLGGIEMIFARPVFLEHFRRSYEICPQNKRKTYMGNVNLVCLADYEPGAVERVKVLLRNAAPYWEARCGAAAVVDLQIAQTDYYIFRLEDARENAAKAMHTAFHAEQHDIFCMANRLLALISLHQGNYAAFCNHLKLVEEYIDAVGHANLADIKNSVVLLKHLIDRDIEDLPPSTARHLYMGDHSAPLSNSGNIITVARLLFASGQYARLSELIAYAKKVFAPKNRTACLIETYLLEALCLFKTNEAYAAKSAFRRAYEMAYHNQILMPFIQEGEHTVAFVQGLLIPTDDSYDKEFIKTILHFASAYQKRLTKIRRPQKMTPEKSVLKLSKRETEVLQDLSMGFTREEIAATRYIAVSTVKAVIASIYSKLGAVNRADAIRIAAKLNLF